MKIRNLPFAIGLGGWALSTLVGLGLLLWQYVELWRVGVSPDLALAQFFPMASSGDGGSPALRWFTTALLEITLPQALMIGPVIVFVLVLLLRDLAHPLVRKLEADASPR